MGNPRIKRIRADSLADAQKEGIETPSVCKLNNCVAWGQFFAAT